MSQELLDALENIKDYKMDQKELEQQRVSFVYGNGSSDDNGTKESVHKALELAEVS